MKQSIERPSLLLTGSEGMLGKYLREAFGLFSITALNRSPRPHSLSCDLACEVPELPDVRFSLVIHAAGTSDEQQAIAVNLEGTKNLIRALDKNPPYHFLFISDAAVYGRAGGSDIDEDTPAFTSDKVGQSKYLAEQELRKWAAEKGVKLLILRPAPMFGAGMKGEMADLFNEVASSRYIHLRGNDACFGIVTAYDVARVARELAWEQQAEGVFNVADGFNRPLLDLVNAMSANTGRHHRPIFLPPKWAAFGAHIPGLRRMLDTDKFRRRATSITYSNRKTVEATGHQFFDTVAVIAREEPDYPYQDD